MKKILLILITLLMPIKVSAKNADFLLNCDAEILKENDDFICRAVINGSFNYDKVTFNIESNDGVHFLEARTNYSLFWDVKNDKNDIIAKSKSELLNGRQEFAILLFSANKPGNYNINITNIKLYNTEDKKNIEIKDFSKTLKIMSSINNLKSIKIDGKKIPNFSPTVYDYYFNINNESTEVSIKSIPFDETSKITGDGKIKINPLFKETIHPIVVTSETDVNRIYRIHLINQDIKDNDLNLSSIKLVDAKNDEIDFNFNPNIYQYNIEIRSDINNVIIKSFVEDKEELSFIKGHENQNIKLLDGDNVVLITIKDKQNNFKTYTINIVKLLFDKASNTFLKSLNIKGYNLKFNKRIKSYKLAVKDFSKNLEITAIPEDMNSTVQITGNNNLGPGSIIKVEVKAENESKDIYQLLLINKENIYFKYLLFIIPLLIIVMIFQKIKTINIYNKIKRVFKFYKSKKEITKEIKKSKKDSKKKTGTTIKSKKDSSIKVKENNKKAKKEKPASKSASKKKSNTKTKTKIKTDKNEKSTVTSKTASNKKDKTETKPKSNSNKKSSIKSKPVNKNDIKADSKTQKDKTSKSSSGEVINKKERKPKNKSKKSQVKKSKTKNQNNTKKRKVNYTKKQTKNRKKKGKQHKKTRKNKK